MLPQTLIAAVAVSHKCHGEMSGITRLIDDVVYRDLSMGQCIDYDQ